MIKKFISLIFLINFLNANPLDESYSFAVNINNYNKVYQNKIKSVITRISKEFENLHDKKHIVNVSFIDNSKSDFLNSYVNYLKFNGLVSYTSYYLRNKEALKKASKYFFTFDHNQEFQQYILLVNKKANIKSLKDLKGKRFVSFIANNNYNDWLDYLTLKGLKQTYKNLIKKENKVQKDSTLVLDLYFDKADFTVIRKSIFEDIVSLNPAILKKVSIIKESEPIFLYGIGMFHKNTPKKIIEGFDLIVRDGTFNNSYQQVLKVLGNTKIKKTSFNDIKKLEDFYDEYMELKRAYNDKNK
ncbi:PhnD/SsuA/transferrin family substrate-binding protein [Halarcobacter mediterraneus]|uniref:PhnD/SsuA/transferrin family substrate-binding protein n=1 Tax=Halarcobacter mediterraneus TaxID=2023153 RepID=UPI0013E991BF|nr:PhnD/SsuA/transferrin family substrate-binding protein [Halarcobacter mediterraneus]